MGLGRPFAVCPGPLFWPPDMRVPLFPHVGKTKVPGKAATGDDSLGACRAAVSFGGVLCPSVRHSLKVREF